ncbi:MAG TPA: MMPL family transporter [Acidimicrobiales bacterium]|nr:MMPL family transporter [Acidimicrobiales bacterium]
MFDWLGRLTARYARWVIVSWLGAAVLAVLFAPSLEKVGVQNETAFLPASAPSQQADRVLQRLYPGDPTLDSGIVVFSRAGRLSAADDAWIARWVTGLKAPSWRGQITSVQSDTTDPLLASELRARDGRADLVVVGFGSSPFSTANNATVAVLRHQLAGAPTGLAHHLSGIAGLAADQATSLVSSFARAALITVVLVLAILFLVYRSALAPLVPLVTIGAAYLVARGLIAIMAAHGFKVASLVDTFLIVMVFGAGTDYCLFIVSRYREDLQSGDQASQTLRRSMRVVGVVVAASGATVIVGFMSMLTARFGLYRTMGPAIGIAIAVTVAAALTLTPALLEVAGGRLFWPGPLRPTRLDEPGRGPSRWERLASTVRGHPVEILLAGVILLELSAAGIGWYHQNFDLVNELPASADARAGYAAIADHYPAGTVAPVYVVIDTPGPILTGPSLTAVDHLTDYLKTQPDIAQVRSVTQPTGAPLTSATVADLGSINDLGVNPNKVDITPLLNAIDSPGGLRFNAGLLHRYPQLVDGGPLAFFQGGDGHSTRVAITLTSDPYSPKGLAVVRDLDAKVDDAMAGSALAGAQMYIGGPATFFSDMQTIGNHDFRVIAAVLIAGIFTVLALLLRSLVAPFYLLASVVASYAATLGLTSAVFNGIFHQSISFWLPPFLLVILVALGADYTIFIMSRIREEAAGGTEIHQAVTRGLTATGKVITSAGIILAGAFAALVTAPLGELRQIGFAVTVGVLIDTFVVRTLIVPAATMLLGRWAFWPGMPAALGAPPPRRRHYGLAGAGIASLAAGLVLLAATGGAARPVTHVAALADSRVGHPPTARSTTVATTAPNTAAHNHSAIPTTTFAGPRTSRPTTTGPPRTNPVTIAPTSTPTTTVAAHPTPTGPTRIAIPAVGAWRYQVSGTRKIGAAGSTQSFNETDTTQVGRVSGDSQTATMSVDTQTSTYTENDQRSYAPGGVDLLSTNFTADGISYGGTLQPPQQLIPWPATVGQSWTGNWSTGSTSGHTTGQVTGTQTVTVSGVAYQCIIVKTDTTFSGSAQGSQQGTTCWSPQLGMALQDTETLSGTYTGIPFDINSHFVLLAAP